MPFRPVLLPPQVPGALWLGAMPGRFGAWSAFEAHASILLHCAACIGRTGTTAACVLKALGLPAEQALQQVRDAGSNPENAQQSGLVDWF
ncbi:MAG: hypothetical protein EOO54_02435 [Haliea sp.]|nr:MAG: hypothetical protein EOO54_02435 [Haliea sp.]